MQTKCVGGAGELNSLNKAILLGLPLAWLAKTNAWYRDSYLFH